MSRHRLEVADVVCEHERPFLAKWGHTVRGEQRQALRDIGACRTAALGGHLEQCTSCAHRSMEFNSCRNRHCPKCQSTARDRWLAARASELLPVAYCHVIFTIVGQLRPLALENQRVFYRLLFQAVAETLLEVAANPRLLGARIGILALLHTWSQTLLDHPHIHCLVPAGGLSLDGSRWIRCGKKFFLPVAVLRAKFRGKLLAFLKHAFEQGELRFPGRLAELSDPARFSALLETLRQIDWIVCVKKPLRRPQHVLKYLARYTYRSAISNGRLLSAEQGRVRFRCRASRRGPRTKTVSLDGVEFLRRFLLHVLPRGFVRIRSFGLLAHRHRSAALAKCRQLLADSSIPNPSPAMLSDEQQRAVERRCPRCHCGLLRIVEWLSAAELFLRQRDLPPLAPFDSS